MVDKEKLLNEYDKLYSAVAEQQFTLNSLGWNEPHDPQRSWSKAGAQYFQYKRIEIIMDTIRKLLDGVS